MAKRNWKLQPFQPILPRFSFQDRPMKPAKNSGSSFSAKVNGREVLHFGLPVVVCFFPAEKVTVSSEPMNHRGLWMF
jgi:hypothetical protein